MKPFQETSERFRQIYARALQDDNRARYHEGLWRYYGNLGTPEGSKTRTRFTYDLCRLARFDPEGKVILDAGCGYGAIGIILYLAGAKEIHGIDVYEPRLSTFQQMIEDFQLNSIHAHLASVDCTPFPDKFFDMVLSNEAISHYSDVEAFLREAARILKPGGVLLIADGNNGANPQISKLIVRLWERVENGPLGELDGHRIRTCYLEMRAAIIREVAPDLDESIVQQIARGTSGMIREQIIQQIAQYRNTGVLPSFRYQLGTCPRNPETGALMEQLFHPRELAARIEKFGFQARFFAYFGGASGNPVVRLVNAVGCLLSPLVLRWARAYRIVAIRT